MKNLFLFLAVAASTATMAGLVDAAAFLTGGAGPDFITAAGIVWLAAAWGARSNSARLRPALAWLAVAGIGWSLAQWGPLLAPAIAGNESQRRWLAPSVQLLGLGYPALLLGKQLKYRLQSQNSGLAWPIFGAALGWTATVYWGLGALWFWLVSALAMGLPTAESESESEKKQNHPSFDAAAFLLAASLASGWLFLAPLLALFDGHSSLHHGARWLTASILIALGAALIGTRSILRPWLGCAFSGLLVFGWQRASTATARLEESQVFNMVTSHDRLLGILGKQDRLSEANGEYAPWLLLLLGGLALVAWSAAATLAWQRRQHLAPNLASFCCGAGVSLLACGVLHPELTDWRGALALILAALAAGSFLLATPFPKLVRGLLAAAIPTGLLLSLGSAFAPSPPSSVPFFDLYQYEIMNTEDGRAEANSARSRVRVVTRSANGDLAKSFLLDGRSFLNFSSNQEAMETAAVRLACRRKSTSSDALWVGTPRPFLLQTFAEEGLAEISLAFDPPELLDLAFQFHPDWKEWRSQIHATSLAGANKSSLVFLRETAPWRQGRFAWHPSRIALAASRVAEHGVFAVLLDPGVMVPGALGATAAQLQRHFNEVELWILPHNWQPPQLLLLASDTLPKPKHPDAELLRLMSGKSWQDLPQLPNSAPLPSMATAFATTEFRLIDEINPLHRSHAVLAEISATLGHSSEQTILPFFLAHFEAQVYEVRDTFPNARPAEQVEIGEAQLDILLALARQFPDSPVLSHLWEAMAVLLVEQREVAWCARYFPLLLEDLGWARPAFHVAAGRAALEMLEPERAFRHAQEALKLAPDDPAATQLAQESRPHGNESPSKID